MINSTGGNSHAAMGMFDMLKEHREKHTITTIAVGQVESCALVPFICGNQRKSYAHTRFGIHDFSIEGRVSRIEANSFLRWAQYLQDPIIDRLVAISNKNRGWWETMFSSTPMVYFTAKEMKRLGIVTHIL